MEAQDQTPKLSIQELRGLNEREQFANPELGEFDILKGAIPVHKNTLTRLPGTKLYQNFEEPIMAICQTFDSRKNIIVQTRENVYVISEGEFFNIVYTPGLTFSEIENPENMSYARIVHREVLNTPGGAIGTSWAQRPLTHIVSQINPDGTAATFVTLAANVITLAIGVYRIQGAFTVAADSVDAGVDKAARIRLFNTTTGLPAWDGLSNEESDVAWIKDAKLNALAFIGGHLDLTGGAASFQIEDIRRAAAFGTLIRGNASNLGSFEIYGWLEIHKTA